MSNLARRVELVVRVTVKTAARVIRRRSPIPALRTLLVLSRALIVIVVKFQDGSLSTRLGFWHALSCRRKTGDIELVTREEPKKHEMNSICTPTLRLPTLLILAVELPT